MDVIGHNRDAWNRQARAGGRWSIPVDSATIERARQGEWDVILTPVKPVPKDWFGDIRGKDLLCLASGGGQQAPTFAAAGARVVSFDNSDEQLARDRLVAERDGLDLETIRGDMADLRVFPDSRFDLIFHPVSNVFAPDVRVVWRECYRVLRSGGVLLSGLQNPWFFLFDHDDLEAGGPLEIRYSLPWSAADSLSDDRRARWVEEGRAFEYSHSLDDLIGGQLAAGFAIAGFYEDYWDDQASPLNKRAPIFMATKATKP